MAVVAPGEDPVTMAAEAAHDLLQRFDIDPARIGLLITATESAVDGAKPIAAYVHGMLGLHRTCLTFDVKHACYGGTAALKMAAEWCAARQGTGVKALVIATDVARYAEGAAGEPTQGAGAVAFIVGQDPRLFVLDPGDDAVFTEEVMDFWRPHYSMEAMVQGQLSIDTYLNLLVRTYEAREESSGKRLDDYDYLLFHVPFPKMAYKGFRCLYEREARTNPELAASLGTLEEAFAVRTMSALWANREVGNIYTGSIYLSLAALLERGREQVAGRAVGLFSYGSGCCAEFFSGRVVRDAGRFVDSIGIDRALRRREELSYEQYLAFRRATAQMAQNGSLEAALTVLHGGRYSFRGIADHQRIYCRTVPARIDTASSEPGECNVGHSAKDRLVACSNSARAQMGK